MVSSKRRTSSASMGMGGGHLDSTQSASANVPSLQQQPPPSSQQQQPTAPSKEELPVFHKQSDIGVNVKYMLIDDIGVYLFLWKEKFHMTGFTLLTLIFEVAQKDSKCLLSSYHSLFAIKIFNKRVHYFGQFSKTLIFRLTLY